MAALDDQMFLTSEHQKTSDQLEVYSVTMCTFQPFKSVQWFGLCAKLRKLLKIEKQEDKNVIFSVCVGTEPL
jgi:hypothetical protein